MNANPSRRTEGAYELRFRCLVEHGQALSFPCDVHGQVDLDALSARARHDYFFARTVVGHDFAMPVVAPAAGH